MQTELRYTASALMAAVILWAALEQMDRHGVNQLPVMTDGYLLGILRREDVISFLRALREVSA
ncbi:MAG TPA: CBS domain-containing protein [Blastocatellia bacterium]|nr:CBS domain-containing protein [Blastocatellia bacterium]